MKKINYIIYVFLLIILFPTFVFAYSSKVILGGENIGIHIDTPGVMIIGFYKVNGKYLKGDNEIKVGDIITKVNDIPVLKIDDLTLAIEKEVKDNEVKLTIKRDTKYFTTTLKLEQIDGIYKTGLYVKDGITGIGTLSYIDPETKVYGALGHEILESTSGKIVEVKTGLIFESVVTSIRRSTNGAAGEKNADFNLNRVYGNIKNNTKHGIYGIYKENVRKETIEVGKLEDIEIGAAKLYTVLNGKEKKSYDIVITNIEEYNDIKNLTFKITDGELLNKTGGVIQGMSGSPIVQNNKLIGAVTHVIVNNPVTGYGIFITTMLQNGDEILKD